MTERRNFDAAAAAWDEEPRRVKLAGEIAAAISAALPLSAALDALDFGCGTGLVTLRLAPYLGSIVGVDSSQGMVDRLNAKIQALGCTNARALRLDLEKDELPEGRFHLIASAMTLHHILEVVPLKLLRGLLHPGGWIALADLDAEDGSFHDDLTGVFHYGFNRESMEFMLRTAGFKEIVFCEAIRTVKGKQVYPVNPTIARVS
ncbi:MAG: class I SAM-dependent methyltransferase [Deltaproteobacteria bacterium]|nr:class I SAM-dependent methyltransferase [Deltaproteobacteria bacterium]